MCCKLTNCKDWYVLKTPCGFEWKLKHLISTFIGDRITIYLPCKEYCHRIKGKIKKVTKPLFPGYVFVHKEIEFLLLKGHDSHNERYLHPVKMNNIFARVEEHEMALIQSLAGKSGVIKTSQAIVDQNQMIVITDGPLKEMKGQILYINRRKQKARIMLSMLNQKIPVTLGLEILKPGEQFRDLEKKIYPKLKR